MGAFKDVVFDIQDEIRRGDLSYAEIAERYDVPLETVEEILDEIRKALRFRDNILIQSV